MFGEGNKWPPTYTEWPLDVVVTSCRGGPGPMAALTVTPTEDVFLRGNGLYIFRIQIKRNPAVTPDPNTWTIDYNGESS